jgi:nitrogen fixation-related uncharacterized protein
VPDRLKEETVEDLFPVLFWSGPIGVGAFLAGLGVLFWGISRMQREDKNKSKDRS